MKKYKKLFLKYMISLPQSQITIHFFWNLDLEHSKLLEIHVREMILVMFS